MFITDEEATLNTYNNNYTEANLRGNDVFNFCNYQKMFFKKSSVSVAQNLCCKLQQQFWI